MSYYEDQRKPDAVDELFTGPKRYVNLIIVGVNIFMFILAEIMGGSGDTDVMLRLGASYEPYVLAGQYYRLFACMFLHFGIYHLGNNMLLLLFMGDMLEKRTGHLKYLLICLGGGFIGSLLSFGHAYMTGDYAVSAGASGCVFAVTGALLWIAIADRGSYEALSPKRVLIILLLAVYNGVVSTGVDNFAHVGGALGGFLLAFLLCRGRKNTYKTGGYYD